MSEPQDQDRWRELHDLLGLPPEKGAAAAPSPVPKAPQAHSATTPPAEAKHGAPQPWPPTEPEDVELPPPAPEGGVLGDEISPPPMDEAELPAPLDEEETLPESQRPSGAPNDDDRDPSKRGRRRGRRGRRSRSRQDEGRPDSRVDNDDTEIEPTGDDLAEVTARAASGSDDESRRLDAGDQDGEGARPVTAAEEDDDEPIETFADWNVPSWPEIVASLYRPER